MKDMLMDRAATASPSVGYIGATVAGLPIPTIVTILTGVLVSLQIYKAVTEIIAARRKVKADANPTEPTA
jgi:hypothetical protein